PASELPKLVPGLEALKESTPEHVLRLNEEILMRNLELQSLNLTLERQIRKKTEDLTRSEENYRSLMDICPDPIVICTIEGNIKSVNHAAAVMLGYDAKAEVEGLSIKSILRGGPVEWERLLWQIEKEGAVRDYLVELSRRDGGKALGELSAKFAEFSSGRSVAAVIRDVTERQVIQAQIAEARSEAEFLNDLMSHDITNYAMSALYFLRNLEKSRNLSEEDRRLLGVVLKDIQGAYELSSSVRDLARVKSSTEEDVEVRELQSMIAEGIEEAKRLYSERKVRINFDRSPEPRFVRANALIPRIFTNILTNAIKFDPSSEVVVDIEIANEVRQGVAYWKVTISDYGRGIPDEEKEKVFERFHRLDASIPGTGLGLYVVRFIARSIGGDVWAEDRVSGDHTKGTRMVVLLPKATERQVASSGRARA
ncbi:MAG: PAS domain-containing sensor histidine kinase, partial [Thermoplasmata archaeon]